MNKNIIKSLAAIFPVFALAACSENAWNDEYLDGFKGGPSYSSTSTGEATLSADDYSTISSLLLANSHNSADSAAARAIKSNMYFDATGSFPGSVAIPYYLASTSSPFFNFAEGSTVNITYQEISGTPEELGKIATASTYTLTTANYQNVWGSESDFINAFSPSSPAANYLPNILKAQYPEAQEGDYAIVTYNVASQNPVFGSLGGDGDIEISDAIKDLAVGSNLRATAIVTAQCARGLILTDNAGSILYYNTAIDLSLYPIGTIVKVSGEVSAYNHGLQLSNSASLEVVGLEEYTYSDPVAYSPAMVDASCEITGDILASYVSIKGELSISGTYYNIIIDGASAQGSIYYATDEVKDKIESGKSYIFYGYFMAVSGSSTKYFNMVVTDVAPLANIELTSNIANLKVGDSLSATAVVTAQCTRGLILSDNAGSILYYDTNLDLSAYPVGTAVNVSGEVSAYNRGLQLSSSATIQVLGLTTYSYPAPVAYTAAMVDEACAASGDIQATYVSLKGEMSISGSYYNIIIDGAASQGSLYYATDAIKEKLESGMKYNFYGYFIAVNGSSTKYFNLLVTDVMPEVTATSFFGGATRSVAFAPVAEEENAVYYYNGSAWAPADDVVALNPVDYADMGDSNNNITNASVKIPLYLKANYPYAMEGDLKYVAYDITTNGCSCGLFVYDGSSWSQNNDGMEQLTAQFIKTGDFWKFVKYMGKAIFTQLTTDEIILDRTYMIAYGTAAATAVPTSNNYGYLQKTDVSPVDGVITMNNDENGFTFATTCSYNGTTYTAPAGKFVIRDSNGRYLYLQGTYSSFNLRADSPYIEDNGQIGEGYLFSATNMGDGTWAIVNDRGEGNVRYIYFSSQYNNFAAYTSAGENDYLPYLYILEE